MSRYFSRRAGLLAALALMACGGAGSDSTDDEATSAAALVVGSSEEMWSLLTVPRRGGNVELRQVEDHSRLRRTNHPAIDSTNDDVLEGVPLVPGIDLRHGGLRVRFGIAILSLSNDR